MTKYCSKSSYGYNGFTDTKTTLDPEDDVAHVKWGGKWRIPTKTEMDELTNADNCTWEWITQNGVNGCLVTSKKTGYEGASIFMPASGYRSGMSLGDVGTCCYYWSSSFDTDTSNNAWDLYLISFTRYTGSGNRYYGLVVRPVCP